MSDFSHFNSPTAGPLTLERVIERVSEFIAADSERRYQIIIGTDSQTRNRSGADYVTALIVHRLGAGGIYFWCGEHDSQALGLHDRIYKEAAMSLEFAQEFMEAFQKQIKEHFDLEIHVDVGRVGETRVLINEVVGMIRGSGFNCKIKPESYGASSVADKHT